MVAALKARPSPEYQAALLDGFRWPWVAVAEHAAEAIAELKLSSATKELTALKDSPDPRVLFEQDRRLYANEIVKINHLSNCILCHAPSHAEKDPVRGKIPMPGEPLPNVNDTAAFKEGILGGAISAVDDWWNQRERPTGGLHGAAVE